MGKMKFICTVIVGGVAAAGVLWAFLGKKIKVLSTSLNSFKDENLAYTFQHTPEIQPTRNRSGHACRWLPELVLMRKRI